MIKEGGDSLLNRQKRRGLGAKSPPFFLLSPGKEEGRGRGVALLAPAAQGAGAAGEEGKSEMRVRGFDSPT